MIPALWCIDVEPDDFEPRDANAPWAGFADMVALVDAVRAPLEERSDRAVHLTWLFRMDPMIEQVYGRSDYAVAAHRDLVEAIVECGDGLGIHVHPYRRDPGAVRWYSDHTDREWMRSCLSLAVDTFRDCFCTAPVTLRMGGYTLEPETIDLAVELGLRVDLTVEPGLPPIATDPSHGLRATAPSTDFRGFPRDRYESRGLSFIPLSATDIWSPFRSRSRTVASRIVRRGPRHLPMSPWRDWPSATAYWDLIDASTAELADPHVAIVVRTLPADRRAARNTAQVMRGLAEHPLARRLEFVDPVTLLPLAAPTIADDA